MARTAAPIAARDAALSARLYPRKPKRVPQIFLLPPEVRAWVRACAHSLDVEISELGEGALRRHLAWLDQERRASGLAPLPPLGAA